MFTTSLRETQIRAEMKITAHILHWIHFKRWTILKTSEDGRATGTLHIADRTVK